MEQNLDELLSQLIERYYKRLVNVYHKRIEKARDKEFAISLFVKRVMAFSEFRVKFNDEYRSLMESLEEDYRLGRSIVYSINKLRKTHKKRVENESQHLSEIISLDENSMKTSLTRLEKKTSRYSDINNFTDEEVVRLYAEYQVYEKFTEFLNEEAKPYLLTETEVIPTTLTIEDNTEKNKEFTTARQVLAIHYLLKYCQVKNVDDTEKARFVHFLTGKNLDNIYKKVQSPLGGANKYVAEDLKFVRGYFERLGMKEIVKMINNEIYVE
jgi:hypothetical protein